jgi:hypothetical protein
MQMTDAQKQALTQWVQEGCSLSEIQKRLAKDFALAMTYMDLRLLLVDLKLDLKEQAKTVHTPVIDPKAPDAADAADALDADTYDAPPGGGVTVELDRVMRAGAMVSGSAVFSDGVKATWMLDQMGRLALDTAGRKYRPTPEDVQAFQDALTHELRKRGYG